MIILSLQILKAVPQHAESLGSSGLAMMLAITAHWDYLGSSVAVCWSNSRLAERTGLSRNSIPEVRERLIKLGWLLYVQDGRNSGHYTPKLPEYHAQTSAVECASGVQFTVQTLCDDRAMTVQFTVQPLRSSLGSYIPISKPEPLTEPKPKILEKARNKFVPPTLDHVRDYCDQQAASDVKNPTDYLTFDCQDFIDRNERAEWTYGKSSTKVRDWKAHLRTSVSLQRKWRGEREAQKPQPKTHSPERIAELLAICAGTQA